jgi:ribonuclease HI
MVLHIIIYGVERKNKLSSWYVTFPTNKMRKMLSGDIKGSKTNALYSGIDAYLDFLISNDEKEKHIKLVFDSKCLSETHFQQKLQILSKNGYSISFMYLLIAHTDGACPRNGASKTTGSWAVYFPNADFSNMRGDIPSSFNNQPVTNNRAELMAILQLLHFLKDTIKSPIYIEIKTDSTYCKKVILKENNTSKLANMDILINIWEKRDILIKMGCLFKVSHVLRQYNSKADRLAKLHS